MQMGALRFATVSKDGTNKWPLSLPSIPVSVSSEILAADGATSYRSFSIISGARSIPPSTIALFRRSARSISRPATSLLAPGLS